MPEPNDICVRCRYPWKQHGGEHGPEPCPNGRGLFEPVVPRHADQMYLPFPDYPDWPPTCPKCRVELEDIGYGYNCLGCWSVYLTRPRQPKFGQCGIPNCRAVSKQVNNAFCRNCRTLFDQYLKGKQ